MAADVGGWSLTLPCSASGLAMFANHAVVAATGIFPPYTSTPIYVDVNVAALFMLSYKAVSTAESCAGGQLAEWHVLGD